MKKQFSYKKYIIFSLIVFILVLSVVFYNNRRIVNISDEEIALAGGITPQMFGAKGDGLTNDTKAVQAAIDYVSKSDKHNAVFIPEGVYSARRIFLKKDVALVGESEKSILLADPSCKVWDGILLCRNLDSVYISNITFDGNKPNVYGNHQEGTVNMWVTNCTNVNITGCTFQNNWYLGICLQNSKTINIENNRFLNLDCGVITTDKPSSDILIKDNYFDGAEYSEPISIYALKEGYHENVTIIGNTMKNHTHGSGIMLRAVKNVTVKNNSIDNCGTGIYCTSSKYNGVEYGVYNAIIEDNIITNTVYEGILLTNINISKINNNTIENAGTYGLLTKFVNESIVDNNIFSDSNTTGRPFHGFAITITGMKNSVVSNNQIDIQDSLIQKDRSPISIGSIKGSENDSSNNQFIDNEVTSIISDLYREDLRYSKDNIYAKK